LMDADPWRVDGREELDEVQGEAEELSSMEVRNEVEMLASPDAPWVGLDSLQASLLTRRRMCRSFGSHVSLLLLGPPPLLASRARRRDEQSTITDQADVPLPLGCGVFPHLLEAQTAWGTPWGQVDVPPLPVHRGGGRGGRRGRGGGKGAPNPRWQPVRRPPGPSPRHGRRRDRPVVVRVKN
jgi:hypothetical protein